MRRALDGSALVAAALAFASAPARADLFTPSFIVDDGETAVCQILNLAKKPRTVVIEVRFNNGEPTGESTTIEVPPNQVALVTFDGTNSSRVHCAFLGKVTAKTARAAGEVSVGGQTKAIVPAQ